MEMENLAFRELFQRIVEQYELEQGVAEALLQRILKILSYCDDEYS